MMNGATIAKVLGEYEEETKPYWRGLFFAKNVDDEIAEFLNLSTENIFVINVVSEPRQKMSHWVLLYVSSDDKRSTDTYTVSYFDSFAKPPHVYGTDLDNALSSLASYARSDVVQSPFRVQSDDSEVCGIYCIFVARALIVERENYLPHQLLPRVVEKYFKRDNQLRNDKSVYRWWKSRYADRLLNERRRETVNDVSSSSSGEGVLSYKRMFKP